MKTTPYSVLVKKVEYEIVTVQAITEAEARQTAEKFDPGREVIAIGRNINELMYSIVDKQLPLPTP
jgi:hypothetical protein